METLGLVATASILGAAASMALGAIAIGFGESNIAVKAMESIAQQPDEAAEISKTLFISMAIVESAGIYCFVVSMILIFSNPFWTALIEKL